MNYIPHRLQDGRIFIFETDGEGRLTRKSYYAGRDPKVVFEAIKDFKQGGDNIKLEQRPDGLFICWNDNPSFSNEWQSVIQYGLQDSMNPHLMRLFPSSKSDDSASATKSFPFENGYYKNTAGAPYPEPDNTGSPYVIPASTIEPYMQEYLDRLAEAQKYLTEKIGIPAGYEGIPITPLQGWICPKCGASNSPFTGQCRCSATPHQITF